MVNFLVFSHTTIINDRQERKGMERKHKREHSGA
jgi:hypothetical protein